MTEVTSKPAADRLAWIVRTMPRGLQGSAGVARGISASQVTIGTGLFSQATRRRALDMIALSPRFAASDHRRRVTEVAS